jgi:hypothetical protein
MEYKPEFPYIGEQIIINSGRVTLNSKDDSIFLFGKKAIGFSSAGTINFDSDDKFIVNSPQIYLGLNSVEPLVKGNQLELILNDLLDSLNNLGNKLLFAQDSNGIFLTSVMAASKILVADIKRLRPLIKDIKSNQNYTL